MVIINLSIEMNHWTRVMVITIKYKNQSHHNQAVNIKIKLKLDAGEKREEIH